jgi:short-subunit dehydrogenase
MEKLEGRTAVITGAASGIGKALASTLAGRGMKLVLADIEEAPLLAAAESLKTGGAEVVAVPTDVQSAASVDALGASAKNAFGKVHVVCNNAGVFAGGLCWDQPVADYEWVMGVNSMGVVHGVRTFVPLILEHGEEGHIVNTASMAAVTAAPFSALYTMSKHAVLAFSECLFQELEATHPQVGVSCLCPEAIMTGIGQSGRNRPANQAGDTSPKPEAEMVEEALRATVDAGISPQVMADRVLAGILEKRFYLLGGGDWLAAMESRMANLRAGLNPGFSTPEALPGSEKMEN